MGERRQTIIYVPVPRILPRRVTSVLAAVVAGLMITPPAWHLFAQGSADLATRIRGELRQVFPAAQTWTFEDGRVPHFRGYGAGSPDESGEDSRRLVGLAFVTTDITPTKGYKGPIPILVGMTLEGRITGILLFYHTEPFGYFSIDRPEFAAQFENKSVLDPIEVGVDIDAITRATITLEAAARGIRVGARQVAREFLAGR